MFVLKLSGIQIKKFIQNSTKEKDILHINIIYIKNFILVIIYKKKPFMNQKTKQYISIHLSIYLPTSCIRVTSLVEICCNILETGADFFSSSASAANLR